MSKKSLIAISVGAIAFGIAGIAFAATATKYFQRIKQNTYTGSATVTITQTGEFTTELQRTGIATTWVAGDAVSSSVCTTLVGMEHQSAATVDSGATILTRTSRVYSTKITGLPSIDTNANPPIFYQNVTYTLNGKKATIPNTGSATLVVKDVRSTIYCDGHVVDKTTTVDALPSVGVTKYNYSYITLQPSN